MLADPITAAFALLSTVLSASAQNRQNRAIQQAQREAEKRYKENYERLSNLLSGILADDYSAVSPELINQVVDQAARDIRRAQTRTNESILRDQARRGLAGHSLVDQKQAHVDTRANEALADARLRAELEAQNLTAAQQAQARNLLAGLTADNFSAMNQSAQNLLGSLGQQADTYASLAAKLAAPYLEGWLNPTSKNDPDPTASLELLPYDPRLLTAPSFGPQVEWQWK